MSDEKTNEKAENEVFRVARLRASTLKAKPIEGQYNVEHLKKIHAYIFQDEIKIRDPEIFAGQFRPEVNGWVKYRRLEAIRLEPTHEIDKHGTATYPFYSNMSKYDIEKMEKTLSKFSIDELKSMDTKQASKQLATLYEDLDAIHPFHDGNSRTLRLFTSQIAKEAGFKIDWEKISQTKMDQELIYVARDMATYDRNAVLYPRHYEVRNSRQMLFKDFPKLNELLEKAIEKQSVNIKQGYEEKASKDYKKEFREQLNAVRNEYRGKETNVQTTGQKI